MGRTCDLKEVQETYCVQTYPCNHRWPTVAPSKLPLECMMICFLPYPSYFSCFFGLLSFSMHLSAVYKMLDEIFHLQILLGDI